MRPLVVFAAALAALRAQAPAPAFVEVVPERATVTVKITNRRRAS